MINEILANATSTAPENVLAREYLAGTKRPRAEDDQMQVMVSDMQNMLTNINNMSQNLKSLMEASQTKQCDVTLVQLMLDAREAQLKSKSELDLMHVMFNTRETQLKAEFAAKEAQMKLDFAAEHAEIVACLKAEFAKEKILLTKSIKKDLLGAKIYMNQIVTAVKPDWQFNTAELLKIGKYVKEYFKNNMHFNPGYTEREYNTGDMTACAYYKRDEAMVEKAVRQYWALTSAT